MVDDRGASPLPRRVPGASDSPKPSVRVDRTAIPEDLRQRVLTAIAYELERDEAERRKAQEPAGAAGLASAGEPGTGQPLGALAAGGAGLENGSGATGANGAGAIQANGSDQSPANGKAPGLESAREQTAARHTDTERGVTTDGARGAPQDAGGPPGTAGAPGQGPAGAAATPPDGPPPWPPVPLPRRAPGANGAPPPPAELRRDYLPPSMLGRRLDPEAHTEPLPRISGLHPDVPVPTDDAQPAAATPAPQAPAPAADPAEAAPPAAAVAPDARTMPVPPDLARSLGLAAAPTVAARPAAPPPADPAAPPAPPTPAQPSPRYPRPADLGWPDPGSGQAARTATPAPVAAPRPGQKRRRSGRRWRIFGVFLAVLALIVAGVVALILSGRPAGGHGTGLGPQARHAEAAARTQAVAWVAGQVSRAAVVACDPVTCQALRARGIPASDLYQLGPQTTSPLRSQIIVATATVRAQFGNLLSSVYAPAVLASFGSGATRVDIRETAPHGAAAYRATLSADVANRKASGNELLNSGRVTAAFLARRELVAGDVDPRLLLAIAEMAATHPVYIVDFGRPAPGADAAMPLRQADLAEDAHAHHHQGHAVSGGYLRSMAKFLRGQHGQFRAARVQTVHLAGGAVLRVEFTAPSPLGLLGPHA